MYAHAVRVFLICFVLSFLTLSGTWIVVDGLAHLDDFFAASGPDRPLLDVIVRHYGDVVRSHSETMFGAVALASLAFGGLVSRRRLERRSEILG